MTDATIAFVLHAHLPWVRHAADDAALDERWLHTAITDTYVPLLEVLDGLERDAVPARLTLSLSPTVLGMLADPLLRTRHLGHLDRLVELAEKAERRTRPDAAVHPVAAMYLARTLRARTLFLDVWQCDVIGAFRAHQEGGLLDVITSAATHAILPLLGATPVAVRAQVEVAAAEYQRFFGRPAEGFWLPECAWEPGLDAELARAGFRYFFVDTHAIAHATPRPVYGVYAPVACDSGVAAFGRDPDSARHLASTEEGYPADPCYRDFNRDSGLDPSHHDLCPSLPPDGRRLPTGLKYHCIGGRVADDPEHDPKYDVARARERVEAHARHFVAARLRQVEWLRRSMDRAPVIVCAADAQLFGQCWFEGPQWLDAVLRLLATTPGLEAGTPADHLRHHPRLQRATPGASTCGWKGYAETWLRPETDWVYRHLHAATERLHALCRRYPGADERTRRALTQALRELFLAQASDWASMSSRPLTAAYAAGRTRNHLLRCGRLCDETESGTIDDLRLSALEDADNLFPTLDYRVLL